MCGESIDFTPHVAHTDAMNTQSLYIWQQPDWPQWQYDQGQLLPVLSKVSYAQGLLLGRVADIGMSQRTHTSLMVLTDDVVKTSAIEGEQLNVASVRSSIARRLGVDIGALAPVDRHIDGVVDMVLDATQHYQQPLTMERLFAWHAALFPTGYSGLSKIRVGQWRDDAKGAMQVISGAIGKAKVHFEAPPATCIAEEMASFIAWFNCATQEPLIIKAALAHLWFVTLHPFEDGNGRIARALADLMLARAEQSDQRFYSLSAQIQSQRSVYYQILEATQKGSMDVTQWLMWFCENLHEAIVQAQLRIDAILVKAGFWQRWSTVVFNSRQIKLINRLLDGFDGKLTSSKWAAIAKCSQDTALRDINELITVGVLRKLPNAGRSTSYELVL
jgi:Fic family protein